MRTLCAFDSLGDVGVELYAFGPLKESSHGHEIVGDRQRGKPLGVQISLVGQDRLPRWLSFFFLLQPDEKSLQPDAIQVVRAWLDVLREQEVLDEIGQTRFRAKAAFSSRR